MKFETLIDALLKTLLYRDVRHTDPSQYSQRRKRQHHAFRDRIIRMDEEKAQMIRDMAWLAYGDQVIDTGMKEHLIGEGNEYADMEDWIESYIESLKDDSTTDAG